MLKLVIEFDQARIREEQVCTIEELHRRLDRAAVGHLNLKKIGDGIYQDAGREEDLAKFLSLMGFLEDLEWFKRYAIRMDWYNDRMGTVKNIAPENLLLGIQNEE